MSPAQKDEFAAEVRRKAERLRRGRTSRSTLFRHLLHVSALGWVFILPVLAGLALGHLIARMSGWFAATLLGLLMGLIAGALGVFMQIRRSLTDEADAAEEPGRPGGER